MKLTILVAAIIIGASIFLQGGLYTYQVFTHDSAGIGVVLKVNKVSGEAVICYAKPRRLREGSGIGYC